MTIKTLWSDQSTDGRRRAAAIGCVVMLSIALVAITSTLVMPCVAPANGGSARIAYPESGPLRVLYVGDSLSYGLYTSAENNGFRQRMTASLSKGHAVETEKLGAINYTASSIDLGAIGKDWDLAVVEQGTNDAGRSSPQQFSGDYSKLLDAILNGSPRVQLLCLGVWTEPRFAKYYDRVIETECLSRGGTFRKVSDLFADESNRGPAGVPRFGGVSDDFHPNDLGHKLISERLLGAITVADAPEPWYRSMWARVHSCNV